MIKNLLILLQKDKELSKQSDKPTLRGLTVLILGFPLLMILHLLIFIVSRQVCITLLTVYLFIGIGQVVVDLYDIMPKEHIDLDKVNIPEQQQEDTAPVDDIEENVPEPKEEEKGEDLSEYVIDDGEEDDCG